ncbi:sialate O-acetylesterase, partial [Aquiflexum sp.]|uniref:sialate O-acetylesterase n=1 Tax=Aquiflexum sp. TaxID=1872584 RepID=UPI003593B4CE
MRRGNLFILLASIQLLVIQSVYAEIKLPALVSSNMVLQRNATVVLWGWADAKESISIDASWLTAPMDLIADNEGNWRIEVKTTNSKQPQIITIKSETSNVVLENILFGEVWLCSGQSNMEQPIKGFNGQPTFGSVMSIANSHNTNLRLFSVDKAASMTPLNNVEKYSAWQQASPESVAGFSAVAYFFGQQLQEILDVPVGMIHTSWGGSLIEAWMSRETLGSIKEVDLTDVDLDRGN